MLTIIVLMIVLMITQYNFIKGGMESDKVFQVVLSMNITVTSFIGIYLGGALLKMKSYYLWHLNSRYRTSLVGAFVLIVLVVSIIQTQYKLTNSYQILLSFLVPFCITFFSAFIILGKTKVHQILISVSPLGFYQLRESGFDETLTLALFLIITIGLIIYLFRDDETYNPNSGSQVFSQDFQQSAMKSTIITKINFWLGLRIINSILNKKGDLGWAIFTPQTRLAFGAILNVLIIGAFYLLISFDDTSDKKFPIDSLMIMFLPATLLNIILESSNNIGQTKKMAHIFSGEKHQYLKNQILFIIDKTMIFSTLVYSSMGFLLLSIVSIESNMTYLGLVIPAVLIVTLAFQPLFMSLSWFKVTFALVIITTIYVAFIMLTSLWIKSSLISEFSTFLIIVFIGSCFGFRGFTESVFKNKPMEELFKST